MVFKTNGGNYNYAQGGIENQKTLILEITTHPALET